MSALTDLIALPGAFACAWVIASHLVRSARRGRPWALDGWALTIPLWGCGLAACLTAAGVIGVLPGVLLAVLAAAAAFVPLGLAWARAVRKEQGTAVARRILAGLVSQARGGGAYIAGDAQAILGLLRRGPGTARSPGGAPVRATPGVPPWRRTVPGVPSVLADPALGAVPAPSEVAAGLAASGVMVPATWAAVAAEAADHEPETDEEHVEHMDGEAAGILTWAEAAMSRAETLGDVVRLDPAYVSAQYELADAIADLAAYAAQVSKRYHDIHDDIGEAADGRALPPREWFGAGPYGGRAA